MKGLPTVSQVTSECRFFVLLYRLQLSAWIKQHVKNSDLPILGHCLTNY